MTSTLRGLLPRAREALRRAACHYSEYDTIICAHLLHALARLQWARIVAIEHQNRVDRARNAEVTEVKVQETSTGVNRAPSHA